MPHIKVAYFGHPGSFSFQAAHKFVDKKGDKAFFYPCQSAREVMDYVLIAGAYGVLPTYNNVGGRVKKHTKLSDKYNDLVIDEVDLKVHHCLIATKKILPGSIKQIYSHPQAFEQCRNYLKSHFKNVVLAPYATTSTAAYDLSHGTLPQDAAVIASDEAAEIYKLKILERNIEDSAKNVTKFKIFHK
jgi:prephenate dehydratase